MSPVAPLTRRTLAATIDHALLNPALLAEEFAQGVQFARGAGVASICVRPCDLRRCVELLGSNKRTAPSTVIGFPHGGQTRAIKVYEAREAVEDADSVLIDGNPPVELDLVVNIGRVLSGDWGAVRDEVRAVCDVTHGRGGLLKVIFETGYLTPDHIRRLCNLCAEQQVDFVKTSTGFGPRGASVADVQLMRAASPPGVRIKASGGIRTLADAVALLEAGADRLGTSRTAELLAACED